MDQSNVQSRDGITLVGQGRVERADLGEIVALAPTVVAADGGANVCVSDGFRPVAVIGDFDSITPETRDALSDSQMIEIAEQDSTDFEKCLSRIDAPFVLAVGFRGRVDHELAVMSVMARRVGPPSILVGEEDVAFAAPSEIALRLVAGTRVSLFPMAPLTGRSIGLKWPIDGLVLDPMGQTGTSNEATGPVHLSFDAPGCLVIMPRAALPTVLEALHG